MKIFKLDEKKLENIVRESISDPKIMIMRLKHYIIDIEVEHGMEKFNMSNESFNRGLDKGMEIYKK